MIRVFQNGDQKDIAILEKECFSEPWSETAILESFGMGTVFFVFEEGERILGYAGMQVIPPEGYITNIAVTSASRGQGIGSALVDALVDFSKEKGIRLISLEVRESNLAAQGLYRKKGFAALGKRKRFYANPTEDAIIMTLEGF